ncbi:MAG: flavodoxin domain-containing protein [Candidatus Peribacteraceae bacterium]
MTTSLLIVYTSTSGHTEFVVRTVVEALEKSAPNLRVRMQRAENTKPEELTSEDVLLLACGSWNTGNIEGQMSPFMHELLAVRAAETKLGGQKCAVIGLGDKRYYYTARAAEKMAEFVTSHGGTMVLPPLKVINDPFDQEEKIKTWTEEFLSSISVKN